MLQAKQQIELIREQRKKMRESGEDPSSGLGGDDEEDS